MDMRTPNYVLNAYYSFNITNRDIVALPEGAFVRPISEEYLPKHILEGKGYADYKSSGYIYCYTRYGIHPIPSQFLREL